MCLVALVVLCGGIDLVVGSVTSLVNVVSALYMAHVNLGGAVLAYGLTGAVITALGRLVISSAL
jgi:ribose/xylose/arabinose/galactoside ABC-type transport system permease subunit